jgi:hypothetical protein
MRNILIGAMLGGLGGAGISYYLSQTTYKVMCQTCHCPQGDYSCCTPGDLCDCPDGMEVCPTFNGGGAVCPNDGTPLECVNPFFGMNPILIIPPLAGLLLGAAIGYVVRKRV